MIEDVGKIYCIVHPDTNEPKYVGQTRRMLKERLACHGTRKSAVGGSQWYRELRTAGKRPKIILLEVVPESRLTEEEQWWIEYLKFLGADLLNRSKGGESGYQGTVKHPERITVEIPDRHMTTFNLVADRQNLSIEKWIYKLMVDAVSTAISNRELYITEAGYRIYAKDPDGIQWIQSSPAPVEDEEFVEPIEVIPWYE